MDSKKIQKTLEENSKEQNSKILQSSKKRLIKIESQIRYAQLDKHTFQKEKSKLENIITKIERIIKNSKIDEKD